MVIDEIRRADAFGWKKVDEGEFDCAGYEKKINEVMDTVPSFTLITLDGNNAPHPRAMSLKAHDGVERVWFATHHSSEHGANIKRNPRVTIFFNNISGGESLMLTGTAHEEKDPENMKKCWREFYKNIFTKGFDDPEYFPIRIEPDSGYYSRGVYAVKFSVTR